MSDFFVFQELPWLRRVIAYVVGLTVMWLFAAIAAFFLSPVLRTLRSTFRHFLERVAARQRESHLARTGAIAAELDQLRTSSHFRKSTRRGSETTALESDEVSAAFRPFFTAAQRAREVLADAQAAFDNLRDCLTQTSVAASQFQTAIPSASEIKADHNAKVREAVHLIVGLVFLAALMIVNTGMLSQILKDLEIVPTTLKYGSFQLFYIFALLLTAAEAGTGVLFGYLQHRVRRDAPGTRLAPLFAVVIALTVAFVEASFYSRVGAPAASVAEDTIHVPVVDAQVPFSSVMFSWGFALVMLMFGSGMMIHNAYTELAKDSGLRSLRRRLSKASKESASLGQAMRVVEERQHALLEKTQQVIETFTREFVFNGSPELLIKNLTEQLKAGAVPTVMHPNADDRLSSAEMKELELRAVFWWWTALISVVAGVFSIQTLYTVGASPMSIGSTIVIFVLLAFGLGLDLSKQDVVAGLAAHATHFGRRLFLRRAVRVLALAILGGLALVVLLRPLAVDRLLPWLVVSATATVVILAGRELAPWFGFVVIHLRRIAGALIWLLAKAVWLVIALLYAVVVVIDGVVELVAAPMTALFSRRVQPAS